MHEPLRRVPPVDSSPSDRIRARQHISALWLAPLARVDVVAYIGCADIGRSGRVMQFGTDGVDLFYTPQQHGGTFGQPPLATASSRSATMVTFTQADRGVMFGRA
jgi:hypothetical protein